MAYTNYETLKDVVYQHGRVGKCSPVPVTYIQRPSLGKLLISTIAGCSRRHGGGREAPRRLAGCLLRSVQRPTPS
ncbi:hypothetical protein B5X24_HaOG209600 [Helicoverpa armigera]|nr:hypothetical protein B5X24_HaOG209600 [Helicoverpa armigera]